MVETAKLRDKVNVLKQLLATLTDTYAPPYRPPGFGEDLSLSLLSASVTYIDR
jgi:hypothetical protein